MQFKRRVITFSLLLLCTPVWAREEAEPAKPEFRTWGVRVGVADDPDQVVGGAHFDLGEIVDRLRFQPNIEVGLGDDHTILAVTAPVHYRFEVEAQVAPYAGGGLVVGFVDRDGPGDDTNFEIALKAVGGAEWQLKSGNDFFVELNLVFGDLHDLQVLAGWTF